jgi:rubrerythrin
MRRLLGTCLGLGTLFLLGSEGAASAADTISPATLTNLQTAFNGESNAHARYLAFARKADEESYSGVASLFRAAARAEEIHAANHSAVIRKSGATPEAKIESPIVKSTAENLRAAVTGESYERDEMYPGFISQAREAGEQDAVRTFTFAQVAEAGHARLYTDALLNLENRRVAQTFYVCPVCGFTAAKLDFKNCPTCATPAEKYEQVS